MARRTYWLDLFTGATWKEFLDAGGEVSGFRESRGKTVQSIKAGGSLLWVSLALLISACPLRAEHVLRGAKEQPRAFLAERIGHVSPRLKTPESGLVGSLRAAAGVYVTPKGRLVLYVTPHCPGFWSSVMSMAELTAGFGGR